MKVRIPGLAWVAALVVSGAAGAQCPLVFEPVQTRDAGDYVASLVVADFNGDGVRDFVSANYNTHTVTVYLGGPGGTFTPGGTAATGNNPIGLAVGDVNADGHPDVAVAHADVLNTGNSFISVLRGTGTGGLQGRTNHPVGKSPRAIGIADFNNDGRPDVVVTSLTTNSVWQYVNVLLNNPAAPGGFGPASFVQIGDGSATTLVTHDFNNDGLMDVAVTSLIGDLVTVMRGNGAGGFLSPYSTYPVGDRPIGISKLDFNHDGIVDLAVLNGSGNSVSILKGSGNGGFFDRRDYGAGAGPDGMVVADFDGDSWEDVCVVSGSQWVSFLRGAPYETFQPAVSRFMECVPIGVAAGDFNGDTRPDLIMTNGTAFSLSTAISAVPLPVSVTQQPQGVSVGTGGAAVFSVGADGTPLQYQWRRNGVNLVNGGAVSGALSAVLTINPVGEGDAGAAFDCIVSNGCGAVRTDPAGLAVSGGCGSADFNGDGDLGTDADIEAFFRVLAGGGC